MQKFYVPLWESEEYDYELAFGFLPDLAVYLHEDGLLHPGILILPGGAYAMVSDSEAEVVALRFFEMGYHAFVCTYTTNLRLPVPLMDQPLRDASRAMRLIRFYADKWFLDPHRLAICGFSAGGHLAGNLCVHYSDLTDPSDCYRAFSNRPDAAVLGYPLISMEQFPEEDCIRNLLGTSPFEKDLHYCSLETQVTARTPPCFLWHTATDQVVSPEHSLLFARALKANGVPCACHLFSFGPHGLSINNVPWEQGAYGENHTGAQTLRIVREILNGRLPAPNQDYERLKRYYDPDVIREIRSQNHIVPEVSIWPELACQWLSCYMP